MMRHLGINITVTAKKGAVLDALRRNREQHVGLVAEAKAGYLKAAQDALNAKLDEISTGKAVALTFPLKVPVDFTRIYTTTIAQLEAHQGDEIKLSTSEYNMLVEDEWDWVSDFVNNNAAYSGSTRAWSATKAFKVE